MKSYLDVTDIAKITKVQRSTIINWINSGKFGKVQKVGNEYRIPHTVFKRWWDENIKTIQSEDE